LPNHEIIEKSFVPNIQITAQQTKIIKTEHVQQQLQLFAKSGFSASSISNYLRNPKDFFVNNLLRLREAEEVEESIAANTLGNVIHKTLEELYKPYINSLLTVDVVKLFINTFEKELVFQYQAIFKEGDLTKGKNLIAFEMSKKLVFDFLKKEMEAIKNGNEIIVLACEQTMTIELKDDRFPYPVFLKGNIDRIEKRNGVVRIIDYKTGKVEPKDLSLNVAKKADIFSIKTEKIMQLLCYALLMQKSDYIFQDLQVGIVSFKNLKDYMMLLTEKEGHKILTDLINEELLESFEFQLKDIIWEIINPELPFLDQPKRKNINY
jgi:ATP-dependent exoDNAse (exonuclease V) beta subunit